jgi:hypothetical protein
MTDAGTTANSLPEGFLTVYAQAETVIANNNLSNRPFWDDEAGYTASDMVSDVDLQEAYVAREYVLQASVGMGRFYWYQWDTPRDGLQGSLAGAGYIEVAKWLTGSTLSACTRTGTVYSCSLTKNGVAGAIEWDTSQTCSGGTCTSKDATAPGYGHYVDLTDATNTIGGGGVPLGAKPVLLQP